MGKAVSVTINMISSVYWEWELLLLSIKAGIKFALLYDGILIFRMLITHVLWIESLEDLLFWVYVAANLFQLQLNYSSGVLRGFSILGVIVGMWLYHGVVGKHINKLAKKGISVFKRRLTKTWKLFKIKLCKQNDGFTKCGRKDGTQRNSDEEKESK